MHIDLSDLVEAVIDRFLSERTNNLRLNKESDSLRFIAKLSTLPMTSSEGY